jgi:hypothetical protein
MKIGLLIAAAGMVAASAFAAVESGLKPGTPTSAFQVVDVTGPHKGQQLCYRCSYGAAPVIAAFLNGDVMKSAGLVSNIQKLVEARQQKGLKTFVVYMGGPDQKGSIEKVASEHHITIPLVFLPQGTSADDVAAYRISSQAKNTVLLWKQGTVRHNFVDVDRSSFPTVAKAVDEMLK